MIDALLNPVGMRFPKKIRLKQDMPFIIEYNSPYHHEPFVLTLKKGEVGERFDHTDCYCFETREGQVPYFSRVVLARLPDFVEVVDE